MHRGGRRELGYEEARIGTSKMREAAGRTNIPICISHTPGVDVVTRRPWNEAQRWTAVRV